MSYLVDYHLQPLVHKLLSFVKGPTHFLNKHLTIGNFPANSLIVTFDISLLYTNIPHNEGINSCKLFYVLPLIIPLLLALRLCGLIPMILTRSNFPLNFFSHPPLPEFFFAFPPPHHFGNGLSFISFSFYHMFMFNLCCQLVLHISGITKICYIKSHPNVKFSMHLKKAGFASRNVVHLQKNYSM